MMRGLISFHPVEPGFFHEVVQPLVAGDKIDPEPFLQRAMEMRVGSWAARRYVHTMELLLEQSVPPPPPTGGTLWEKMRSRMEVFDFKADPLSTRVKHAVVRDLHLLGRPYLIADASPEQVGEVVAAFTTAGTAARVDQLVDDQLDLMSPKLGGQIQPESDSEMPPDMGYRAELMETLKEIHDLSGAARKGEVWTAHDGRREPASTLLPSRLPWQAIWLHSRIHPFWMGLDVDGLETICKATGIPSPEELVPAVSLFGDACDEFPKIRDELHHEITSSQSVGGYVPPEGAPSLVAFLKKNGASIIQAATRQGEGTRCTVLLRKIRECATYASCHGLGYMEASGIEPIGPTLTD
jgi:hypothetical protein